jgi:hypothetical protein
MFEEHTKIPSIHELTHLLVAQPDSIVEVAKPDNSVVIFDSSVPLKSKSVTDRPIIGITLIVISKTGS